jgi:hypothetical protein
MAFIYCCPQILDEHTQKKPPTYQLNMADAYSAQILQSWNEAFDVCQNLFDADELVQCIIAAERDLCDLSMPLYHRMRYELFLARSYGDWDKANNALIRCKAILASTSNNHKDDPNELIQERLQEVRELARGVRAQLDKQRHEMGVPRSLYDDVDMVDESEEDESCEEAAEDAESESNEDSAREGTVGEDVVVEGAVTMETEQTEKTEKLAGIERTRIPFEIKEVDNSVKSGLRLPTTPTSPKLSADPLRLPETDFEEKAEPASRWRRGLRATSAKLRSKFKVGNNTNVESGENKDAVKPEPESVVEATQRLVRRLTSHAIRSRKQDPTTR